MLGLNSNVSAAGTAATLANDWILNADTHQLIGRHYVWQDSSSWTDSSVWKD
jgi:hypothetical protein